MAGGIAARGSRRRRARRGPVSEINVTPLVDVVMVLLIIFMVAAPMLVTGVPLQLPDTSADALPLPDEEPLTVQIDGQGVVYVQNVAVPPGDLAARLAAIAQERREDQVFLRADARLDYGQVMRVMGALKDGGFRSVALVTDAEGGASPDADAEAGEAPAQ
ncbi:MAG: ExbD/TolR family protein [Pseudomonadota bacterium]